MNNQICTYWIAELEQNNPTFFKSNRFNFRSIKWASVIMRNNPEKLKNYREFYERDEGEWNDIDSRRRGYVEILEHLR